MHRWWVFPNPVRITEQTATYFYSTSGSTSIHEPVQLSSHSLLWFWCSCHTYNLRCQLWPAICKTALSKWKCFTKTIEIFLGLNYQYHMLCPGLLRFCKPCRKNSCDLPLPDPSGSLSEKMDSSAIEEANKEITTIIVDEDDGWPTILINVISMYIAVCFTLFHHYKSFHMHIHMWNLASHMHTLVKLVYAREHIFFLKINGVDKSRKFISELLLYYTANNDIWPSTAVSGYHLLD